MSRMEEKKAVRRTKKIGNAHLFEPLVTRKAVYRRLIDDLLDLFGGSPAPVMSHLVDSGELSLEDIRAVEKKLESLEKKRRLSITIHPRFSPWLRPVRSSSCVEPVQVNATIS